jgi:FkbM family methyltransferase
MIQHKVWNKPLLLRWTQKLWGALDRWSQATGWPLEPIAMRIFMLAIFPLYLCRLGFAQGFVTFYRFMLGDYGMTIYRSERDTGTLIREDSTDLWVFQQIFILREYRPLAGRDDVRVIIDAGAYVGYSAIYFAELYPHAFIYALEPEEGNFQALQRNTRHYPNIKAIQAAVWKEDGYLEIEESIGGAWAFHVHESSSSSKARVAAITIKSLMEQYRLPSIDILKMDIEGAESAVFEAPSCHAWLGSVRILVLELHDHLFPGSDQNFKEAIQQYPFKVQTAGENLVFELPEAAAPPALASPQRRFS